MSILGSLTENQNGILCGPEGIADNKIPGGPGLLYELQNPGR